MSNSEIYITIDPFQEHHKIPTRWKVNMGKNCLGYISMNPEGFPRFEVLHHLEWSRSLSIEDLSRISEFMKTFPVPQKENLPESVKSG